MLRRYLAFTLLLSCSTLQAAKDPDHYTSAGFFDIHVCNWPDRPPFYLALLSTERFTEIDSVTITAPSGSLVGQLSLAKYRKIKRKNKPEKRAFIDHIQLPQQTEDGWYKAEVILKDGERVMARDFVTHELLGRASGHQPAHGDELDSLPTRLRWEPLPGAGFYQAFIRDMWDDGKGFDQEKVLNGMGMDNLRLRTQQLNGKLHIDSAPGKGTYTHISIPV